MAASFPEHAFWWPYFQRPFTLLFMTILVSIAMILSIVNSENIIFPKLMKRWVQQRRAFQGDSTFGNQDYATYDSAMWPAYEYWREKRQICSPVLTVNIMNYLLNINNIELINAFNFTIFNLL